MYFVSLSISFFRRSFLNNCHRTCTTNQHHILNIHGLIAMHERPQIHQHTPTKLASFTFRLSYAKLTRTQRLAGQRVDYDHISNRARADIRPPRGTPLNILTDSGNSEPTSTNQRTRP